MLCDDWCDPIDVTDDTACEPCADETLTDTAVDVAITLASRVLYELSGRKYPGVCSQTIRPACACQHDPGPPSRRLGNRYPRGCRVPQIELNNTPVVDITQVTVDGTVLAESAYRVDNKRWLVRVDGDAWPCSQDFTLDPTEVGTWEVVYEWGAPIPEHVRQIAAVYACELAKGMCGSQSCRLPANIQSLTRQNTQVAFLDPSVLANEGLTGVPEVDVWLRAENPQRRRGRMLAAYPAMPQHRRTSDLGGS